MEDEPVTGSEAVDTAPEGQAVDTAAETAASDQTEIQPDLSDAETTTNLSDEDIEWAKKKGVNLDDKAAVAKMLRNSDRKISETALKSKTSLQQTVDQVNTPGADDDIVTELKTEIRQLRSNFAATQYYLDNPDDKALDADATAILKETMTSDPELARGLGRNLPALFALARARHSETDVAKAKDEGRKEERRTLAGKQRASATSQAATTSAPVAEEDPYLKGFGKTT